MADSPKKFQSPKGTRDFYPADLAVRRHIEDVWRKTSINHGFEEIDGPTFEHLDLYTHKSGPGIASELFQVFSGKDPEQVAALKKEGGIAPYALRPEFTPTLARMVAAKAPELPRPIKWFAIPSHFRAESPQRGRLREFMQWNVDFIGDDSPRADAEVIATAVQAMSKLGLAPQSIRVKINDRRAFEEWALLQGVRQEQLPSLHALIDKRSKIDGVEFKLEAARIGLPESITVVLAVSGGLRASADPDRLAELAKKPLGFGSAVHNLIPVCVELRSQGVLDWCEIDTSIVRGLAYYTGTVFEIIAEGERAIAGGGRYDKLIESFGGPSLPACGFGMGDVVLANILKDKGLLKPAEEYLPRPDAFVIAANDDAAAKVPSLVAELRKSNLHIRQSYKTTRNVGKLLADAGKCRARYAVILGTELAESPPRVALKNLDSGSQDSIPMADLASTLRGMDANSNSH